MNDYIALLKSQPILRRLSTIQLIAYLGAWFSNVAIYTLLLELDVSPEVVAFTAMLHFLAGVIQAPFSGAIIDRSDPKKLLLLLIAIEIVSTFCLVFINSLDDLNFLYILIFIKMAAASFYFTTEMSILPKILSASKLQKANELHSMIWSLSYTLGMALGGVVVYYTSVKVAFILDSFMFVVGFYLLYSLKLNIKQQPKGEPFFRMMRASFTYLKQTPQVAHLMLAHAFVGITAFDALVVLMVDSYYSSIIATSLAIGLMHALRAIGLVLGPMLLSSWINSKRIVYLFIGEALAVWLWAFVVESFYLSLLVSVCVGFFVSTLWSYTYTLLQHNTDENYYGRIVAYNDMLFLGFAAFTSFLIGFLATNNFSIAAITVILGCGFVIGAIYFMWILKTQNIKELDD